MAVSSPFDPYEALANKLGIRAAIDLVPDSFEELPQQLAERASIAVLPRDALRWHSAEVAELHGGG